MLVYVFVQIDEDDAYKWQKTLYKKIGSKQEQKGQSMEKSVQKVLAMAKVLQGLHLVRLGVLCVQNILTYLVEHCSL